MTTAALGHQSPAPAGLPRLLAGWAATGQPASLAEHTARYGPLPGSGDRRRSRHALLAQALDDAGLRGRGGAGFPTGRKLRAVAEAGTKAIVVVNGVESEPASSKDRLLLHAAPHLVLDGAVLVADALGAEEIHLAVHAHTGLADSLRAAAAARLEAGQDTVSVQVSEPPRRYVASEESALVQWLSGRNAQPTFTPPRPYQRGVRALPTLVNNAETLAHVALIARYGAGWFRAVGAPTDPGSLLVTVSGAVRQPGVLEVAMGSRIGDVLQLAGSSSQPLQAILIGGYFGTWVQASDGLALPLTHAGLLAAQAGLGAGVLVALPRGACGLAETARVMTYLAEETAGQCGPCLNGLPALADDLTRLANGRSSMTGVQQRLDRRLQLVDGRGACRHPDGAVRFAASALRTFSTDVRAHLRHQPCAGRDFPAVLTIPGEQDRDRTWR